MKKTNKQTNKHSFKVGDRIGFVEPEYNEYSDEPLPFRFSPDNDPGYGKVVDIGLGKVRVLFDDRDDPSDVEPKYLVHLMPEDTLKKEWNRLEKEFKEVQKQIASKMKEAAKIITEANKIANKSGHSLAETEASYLLERAMDSAGWRTSSWGC